MQKGQRLCFGKLRSTWLWGGATEACQNLAGQSAWRKLFTLYQAESVKTYWEGRAWYGSLTNISLCFSFTDLPADSGKDDSPWTRLYVPASWVLPCLTASLRAPYHQLKAHLISFLKLFALPVYFLLCLVRITLWDFKYCTESCVWRIDWTFHVTFLVSSVPVFCPHSVSC